jgi:hypothetical protein
MHTTRKDTYAAPRLTEVGTLVSRTLGGTQVREEADGLKNIVAL